jgi:signal peptidase
VEGVSAASQKILKALDALKGVLAAIIIVAVIVGGLYAYSGVWPPLVVVESNSMQHSSTQSFIGIIDTGDLVIEKRLTDAGEIRTYLASINDNYQTYGEYGDVIIYRPLGAAGTPIIHRAFCTLVYNTTGGGFDMPELAGLALSTYSISGGGTDWHNLKGQVEFSNIGYNHIAVTINLQGVLSYYSQLKAQNPAFVPHGGIITLGDNNHGNYDQNYPMNTVCREPVVSSWIDGVARGELPWFGLLKLWISGPQPAPGMVPANSVADLWISIALIIGVPIAIDLTGLILDRRGIDFWGLVRKKLGLKPSKRQLKREQERAEEAKAQLEEEKKAQRKSKKR